ncbi:predicted protein [Naegleria gruberi]|uniref:Predicted protein n=1 Tax=Naegleria gruberi TaxID=5762 RepID=D2VGH0_NAEGR|nr:uncharacterized protein NAEGRDRAFT_67973 [Naegleria gruberi]EFC43964.1 predicted protein [Naegleria gruberi]|eukprot:XP_002676708.1 predicted protein [Naegleria gruberi strain NEG-M]
MTEIIYFGDYQMFRKLKELYNVSSNSSNNSEKKLMMKRKKKTCLENISFMFKENHFQFPPRLNNNNTNYHGSKSQRIVDFQLGDDFVICQTESTQLYFIGLYSNKGGINYLCEQMPCEKIGKTELIKCCSNKILIKSLAGKFYIAEVKKLDQVPIFKPVEAFVNTVVNETVKGVHFGENFNSVLTEKSQVFSEGRFIITNDRYGYDWIYPAPADLLLPTSVTTIEKIFGDNHSFMVKDANPNALKKYYLYQQHWKNQNPSLEDWILKYFPEEHSITIEDVIPNGCGVGYLVLVSFGDSDLKRIVMIGHKGEFCQFSQYLEVLDERNDFYHTFDFPSYFYSVTGFNEEFSFENCHFTTNFALFEMKQTEKLNFHSKLYKNSQYSDIEFVTQSEGEPLL